MNIEARINNIKNAYSEKLIAKARSEERIKTLEEQRGQIVNQCANIGVDPAKLDEDIKALEEKIIADTAKVEEILGITESSASSVDTPF